MEGLAFEGVVRRLFERLGYGVETTPFYDRGADLVLTRDGTRTAVQVKRARGPVRQEASTGRSTDVYGV